MPARSFADADAFRSHTREATELIFDGFENLTERPRIYENQKVKYSGKKHTHTDMGLLLSDKSRWIYYVSYLYSGHQVDMGIFKLEFPVGTHWFRESKVVFDLGFQGVGKLYEFGELVIGNKKPRKSKNNPETSLTKEQEAFNKQVSSERIYVEHAIGRMKKYRMLKNRSRLKRQQMKNRIIGICAAISNYLLNIKHSKSE
jgi:hypothetical protein